MHRHANKSSPEVSKQFLKQAFQPPAKQANSATWVRASEMVSAFNMTYALDFKDESLGENLFFCIDVAYPQPLQAYSLHKDKL